MHAYTLLTRRLTFLAAPVVPGLCLVCHLNALLGSCELHIQANIPQTQAITVALNMAPSPVSLPGAKEKGAGSVSMGECC